MCHQVVDTSFILEYFGNTSGTLGAPFGHPSGILRVDPWAHREGDPPRQGPGHPHAIHYYVSLCKIKNPIKTTIMYTYQGLTLYYSWRYPKDTLKGGSWRYFKGYLNRGI